MSIKDWMDFFKRFSDVKVFHINHLRLLTGMNGHSLRMALYRLNNKNLIKRICKGFYANPFNLPMLEEISNQIYSPSYISLESALSSYAVLSQIPVVLTCVTTRLPRTFNTGFGIIEYHQIKPDYFWGFSEEKGYYLAEKEKALLDYIYLSTARNRKLRLSLLKERGINKKKIAQYAVKMNIPKGVALLSTLKVS